MDNPQVQTARPTITRELVKFNDIIGDIRSGKLGIDPNNGGRTPILIGSEGIFTVSKEAAGEITKLSGITNGAEWNVTLLTGGDVVITDVENAVGDLHEAVDKGATVESQSLSLNATVLKWYPGLASLETVPGVQVKVRCVDLDQRSASPTGNPRPALEAIKPEAAQEAPAS